MAESKPRFACPVCLEVLKSPKILPCLHSFCQQCINKIILSTVQNKLPKPKQFACPVCHTVVKPRDPTAYVEKWASLLQDNTAVGTAEKQECHTCKHHNETSVANFWCKNCQEAFCEKCNTMHGWMKLTSSHNVIPFEDVKFVDSGIDLEVISEKCCLHTSNVVLAFCFDHEELCCVLCLTSIHRRCENVKAFSNIPQTKRISETLSEVLMKMKQETEKHLVDKEKKAELLKNTTVTIEEDAVKFVQNIKCRLDDLLGNFIKQLRIIKDEKDSELQADVQFLSDFTRTLGHWIEGTEVVQKFGTETQFFIHSKTMIGQIKENITQLGMRFSPDIEFNLSFNKHHVLTQVADLKDIGTTIVQTKLLEDRTKELYKLSREIGIKTSVDFHCMAVKHTRNICIHNADIKCGVSIDDNYAIVGSETIRHRSLHSFYIKTGDLLNTTSITGTFSGFNCLCFDKKSKYLFVAESGTGFRILMAEVDGYKIKQPRTILFDKVDIGSKMVVTVNFYDDFLYVVSSKKIQKFKSSADSKVKHHFTLCLATNIDIMSEPTGLAIRDGNWFYTSNGKEIKCLKIQGNELFSFQSFSLKSPGCLTVTPSGVVVVVDRAENGSLHAISSNGKDGKKLLRKFDKMNILPMDVWTDDRGETICVCGGQDIEVYRIEKE